MITVSGLEFTYPGRDAPAITGLDFSIQRGRVFGLLGPSGAGKTTTVNILIGALKGYRGSAMVMDRELRKVTPDYYERIGVAFEFPNLYPKFTARENLGFFRSLYSGSTEDPMTMMSLVGLEQDADTKVAAFSKGMKTRLCVCRAFMHRPSVVFLDEPTAGLDPVNSRRVRELIAQRRDAGTTTLLTTHDMHVAEEICDEVAFIIDGRIPLIDTPRNLRLRQGKRVVRVEYRDGDGSSASEFPLPGLIDNPLFLDILRHKDVETIHTQEATLEDVFVQVTGRRLS